MRVVQVVCSLLVIFNTFSWAQKNPHWLKDRNSIVHLFEWRWRDIAAECEAFLQHKGFGGVQISPPNENVMVAQSPWWERYHPISYKLETRSGNEHDFLDMTTRCNAVGVRIYADVVLNHMAKKPKNLDAKGTGGSTADPEKLDFPAVPYTSSHFHRPCQINNYKDRDNVRNCQLEGLKDLNQTDDYVREKIIDYLNHLVDLGVAGFRIDAAKYMLPSDLEYILNKVKNLNTSFGFEQNSRPFVYLEIIDLGDEAISKDSYKHLGIVTEYRPSVEISRLLRSYDKLTDLQNWGSALGFLHSDEALVFVDSHDNQRGRGTGDENILTYKDPKLYRMATAFMLAYPYGITRIMSSYEFENIDQGPPHDWNGNTLITILDPDWVCVNGWFCEYRWRQIYNMIGFKNAVQNTGLNDWWSNGDRQIAFCRGKKGFLALNNSGNLKQNLQTCLPPGTYCDVISGNLDKDKKSCTGKTVHVGADGIAYIEINAKEEDGVLAIHENSKVLAS
ncbi:hypothetical protein RN001_012772 [Aquatica leii]|uniref:Alpha-amylase n=1 Tax=Aquatica leii TaxID=1421715 RepID=A0AAN7Q1Y3_9COLE|nr:hypothetical protein RN001_012772 [Aquatica leii]